MSTALKGYNSSNLYGKRTSDNQPQHEHPAKTNTTSRRGYVPSQPLPTTHTPHPTDPYPRRNQQTRDTAKPRPHRPHRRNNRTSAAQPQTANTATTSPTDQHQQRAKTAIPTSRRTMVQLLHGNTIRRRRHKMGHTLNNTPSRPIPHFITQRIHSTATTQQPPLRLPTPLPR